ncbi:MAG TPA: DUF4097 family beta strand repeat-containing protein [Pyrinomonadaceae bacterium]|nr:DUF4097 family beta strand repeat-containing protein [Pyrinomonadaceae bacterium]
MDVRCANCGAELFEGQQFCRRCGASVAAEGEDAPTRILSEGAPTSGPPASTSRLGARGTDPVRGPVPGGYAPPASFPRTGFQQTAPLDHAPARRGRGVWVLALAAVAAVSVLGTLALVYTFRARGRQPVVVVKKGDGLIPPLPPDLPERVREAVEASGAPLPVEEGDVTVSDDETTFTKSFPLDPASSFSLRNVRGDVTVEGWDEPAAEVTVVKGGGDARGRAATRVMASHAGGRLALASAPGGSDVTVSYRVKVPRALRHVEVNVERGDVEVSELEGAVVVDVRAGEVTLGELPGAVRGKLGRGDIKVAYGGAGGRREPQEFSVVRGNVTVAFGARPAADLKAETMDGDIEVEEELGPLRVVKTAAGGRHVAGRLAEGGAPLLIKVVNGDIALKN